LHATSNPFDRKGYHYQRRSSGLGKWGQALGVNPKVGQANEVDRKVWMQASREDQEACGDKLSKLTSKEKGY
jgi:hypothetical protein